MSEIFISIDVETAGPIPGEYSLLSIGACNAYAPEQTFLCEIKPINQKFDPTALAVSGISLERLEAEGLEPAHAMESLRTWIKSVTGDTGKPVFVGFNAPFDWSFINYYFHRFGGGNPFGFTALDIKAFYMGKYNCAWADTRSSRIAAALQPQLSGDHNALHDALYQAELFRLMRGEGA